MYSVVMMMALSGGAEATELFGNRCCGCTGQVVARAHVGLFARRACCGVTLCAGQGVRQLCCGRVSQVSIGRLACHGPLVRTGQHGCHGGLFARLHERRVACCGPVVRQTCCGTEVVAPAATPAPPVGTDKKMPPAGSDKKVTPAGKEKVPPPAKKTGLTPAPATLVITLPADASLSVDGNATVSTSARRVLVTPALEEGEYVYNLRAEIVRDGQTIAENQTVNVRPGQTTEVSFSFTQTVASR